MIISIVTSTFSPGSEFEEFLTSVGKLSNVDVTFELIVVEDSNNQEFASFVESKLMESGICDFRLLVNDRNFGQHRSLFIGIEASKGDLVSLIDSDNEEDVSLLPLMIQMLELESNSDIVYCIPKLKRGMLHKLLRGFFYKLFKILSPKVNQAPVSTFRLARRSLIEKVLLHKEKSLNIGALFASTDTLPLYIEIIKSYKGTSSYNLPGRLRLAFQSIISFSNVPLYITGAVGFLGFCISVFSASYSVFLYLISDSSLSGWTSIVLLISGFSGLILLSMGVVAMYLAILMTEVKRRPFFTSEYTTKG